MASFFINSFRIFL